MKHAWSIVSTHRSGRWHHAVCDSCGITVTLIGASAPVSHPSCTLAGAGAHTGSTR